MFILFVAGLQQAQREISEQLPTCFRCLSCFGCPTPTAPIKILVLLLENTPPHTPCCIQPGTVKNPSSGDQDPPSLCPGTAGQASESRLVHWMLLLRTRSPE